MNLSDSDLGIFFPRKEAAASETDSGPVRVVTHRHSTIHTDVDEFESVLAAFYFVERELDLDWAELWQDDKGLCELRKIELSPGSIWQVSAVHKPGRIRKRQVSRSLRVPMHD